MPFDDIAVLKFGGSSVKSIARLDHAAKIVADTPVRKRLVVVSAMGDTTDYLYGLAKQCSLRPDKRELDQLLSTGEQVSIALLSMSLQSLGINAKSFTGQQIGILTDDAHSNACILEIDESRLQSCLQQCDVAVVAGFQGANGNGEITTLGRGGSDTTAVALTIAAGVSSCHIYTDVDGIFTSDPNKLPEAALYDCISYQQVLELAQSGAQVIHPRAVELAKEYGIKLRVRNTFKPKHSGTLITGELEMEKVSASYGVALENNQALCTISGVPRDYPILQEVSRALGLSNISIDAVAQSECQFRDNARDLLLAIRFGIADEEQALKTIQEIGERCGAENAVVDLDVAKVSLIGSGIGSHPLVSADAASLLERSGLEIKLVTGSCSRVSFFILKECAQHAAGIIHDHFCLSSEKDKVA